MFHRARITSQRRQARTSDQREGQGLGRGPAARYGSGGRRRRRRNRAREAQRAGANSRGHNRDRQSTRSRNTHTGRSAVRLPAMLGVQAPDQAPRQPRSRRGWEARQPSPPCTDTPSRRSCGIDDEHSPCEPCQMRGRSWHPSLRRPCRPDRQGDIPAHIQAGVTRKLACIQEMPPNCPAGY
jgi:hypothetical protein